jgi:hypothetical protein
MRGKNHVQKCRINEKKDKILSSNIFLLNEYYVFLKVRPCLFDN